jgi:hypothetical protein
MTASRTTGVVAILFALVAAGCAPITTGAHLERGVSFSDYLTYDWEPPDNLPVGDPRLDNNPFFNDYLQGAIERRLAAKGFERAAGTQPDLLVHYHATVSQKLDVSQVDSHLGYCYANCEPQYVEYEQGTLVLDIVDIRTRRVIWRGWAEQSLSGVIDDQDRLQREIDRGVEKMMQQLPRGGGTAAPPIERSR